MCKNKENINKLYLKIKEESITRGYILIFITGILAIIDKTMSEAAFNGKIEYTLSLVLITVFILYIAECIQNIVILKKYSKKNDLDGEEKETVLDLLWDTKKIIVLIMIAAIMTYIYYIG